MGLDRSDAPQRIPGRGIPAGARARIAFTELVTQKARGECNALSQDLAVARVAEIEIGVADRHRQAVDVIRDPIVADDDNFLGRRLDCDRCWLNDDWCGLNDYGRRLNYDWRRLNYHWCRLSQHGRGRSQRCDTE
jgi:hypothetical protein